MVMRAGGLNDAGMAALWVRPGPRCKNIVAPSDFHISPAMVVCL